MMAPTQRTLSSAQMRNVMQGNTWKGTVRGRPSLAKAKLTSSTTDISQSDETMQLLPCLIKCMMSISTEYLKFLSANPTNIWQTTAHIADISKIQATQLVASIRFLHLKQAIAFMERVKLVLNMLAANDDGSVDFDGFLVHLNTFVTGVLSFKQNNQVAAPDSLGMDDALQNYLTTHSNKLRKSSLDVLKSCKMMAALFLGAKYAANPQSQNQPAQNSQRGSKATRLLNELFGHVKEEYERANIMQGYLTKKSNSESTFKKNWKKRYFVLIYNKISYFEKEGDSKPLRTLELGDITTVSDVSDEMKKKFTFRLDEKLVLNASNDIEFNMWLLTLQDIIGNPNDPQLDDSKPTWNTLKEQDLRMLVRLYDREEKFKTESLRMNYLSKMKQVLQRTIELEHGKQQVAGLLDSADKLINKPAVELPVKREVQEAAKIKFSDNKNQPTVLMQLVKENTDAFLAEISDLSAGEFHL